MDTTFAVDSGGGFCSGLPPRHPRRLAAPLAAALALRAHWDEARFVSLLRDPQVQQLHGAELSSVGPNAIAPILSVLASMSGEADDANLGARKRELAQAVTVLLSEAPGEIAPELDRWIEKPPSWASPQWRDLIARLPQSRRDAVLLAAHAAAPWDLRDLSLASDAAIESAIGRVFAGRRQLSQRADDLRFDVLGDRATPALTRYFKGAADKYAKVILDQTELDDERYAELTGRAVCGPA